MLAREDADEVAARGGGGENRLKGSKCEDKPTNRPLVIPGQRDSVNRYGCVRAVREPLYPKGAALSRTLKLSTTVLLEVLEQLTTRYQRHRCQDSDCYSEIRAQHHSQDDCC